MQILDWHLNENLVKRHGFDAVISALGYIPEFVLASDPRPIWEQINERYVFGGWDPALPGKWKLDERDNLYFPGDPPLQPLATARHGTERLLVYRHAWCCIVQDNGDFSVARLDW